VDAHAHRRPEGAEVTEHQLIYTSCRRGINGVNDGQQVFSYDAGFPTDQIPAMASLMTYRGPDLPPGVPMSEGLVPAYPKSFTYTPLGRHADLALNTYLGKDYMGPTGRFGNFLSHHLVLEAMPSYPVLAASLDDDDRVMVGADLSE
jgi:GTPase-associated protein 1, N-terminal domain type 2